MKSVYVRATNLVILYYRNVLIGIRSVEKETIDACPCLQVLKIRKSKIVLNWRGSEIWN